jgi:hypothetical protein
MPGRHHIRTSCWFQKPVVILANVIAMGLPMSPVIHNLFRLLWWGDPWPKQLRILTSLMAYNPAFSSPLRLRQIPPLPENHHNPKIYASMGHTVYRDTNHISLYWVLPPINIHQSSSLCYPTLPQSGPLHIPGNLSQTCPHCQTESSNCQLNLASGCITSRGSHVHGFPALSSEHLQLHHQNATQAQCQDGRHPTKKPYYCLWRMTSIL